MKKLLLLLCLLITSGFITTMIFLHFDNSYSDSFTTKLDHFIENHSQNTDQVSVYLYFFKSKKTVSYNENYKYMPASLIKVAVMITYYKLAQTNPEILKQTILYEKDEVSSLAPNISPQEKLEYGKTYTIDDLITRMIIFSDNNAINLLMEHITADTLAKTFTDEEIIAPQSDDVLYTISSADYAKFFIELQNASYLNKAMSQKALDILKHSQYKKGLVAGVPSSIPIAHKFGERKVRGEKIANQFHECGIVYVPNNPYLLCVMTDGNDIFKQANVVKNISQFVYKNI